MNFFNSYKSKVAIFLFIVVLLMTSSAFYIYSEVIKDKFYKESRTNIKATLGLLQAQYIYSIKKKNGKVLYSILEQLESKPSVLNAFLVNSDGKVVFPRNSGLTIDSLNEGKKPPAENDVILIGDKTNKDKFFRSFIKLDNTKSCIRCHKNDGKNLGYIVFDLSNSNTKNNIYITRAFSIIFTILLVIIISGAFAYNYRNYLKKSLLVFNESIEGISKGNLNQRVPISRLKELKDLGLQFNSMLDNFQNTRKELLHYHKLELKNSRKLASVGELAARLAHEIRNPITGIANAVEIIVDELSANQNRSILEEVKRQADRVNSVISNLLAFSATQELKIINEDLNELISSLVFFLNNQKHEKDVRISADLDSSLPEFRFDREKLENVLLNLGINAIQAIETEGYVLFTTRNDTEHSSVIISVTDNGVGISEEDKANIFSPFFTTKTEGTGLGLAIVEDIIELHGGRIWVENAQPKGSVFIIQLPFET